MRVVFTRQRDGATFEMGAPGYGAYVLDPKTQLPPAGTLDTAGYERSGKDGGYAIAARFQRRPLDVELVIEERWNDPRPLMQLIAEFEAFFDSHDDTLSALLFDAEFFTCDKGKSAFAMREGAISVPATSFIQRNERLCLAQVGLIFGDPYRYHTSGAGVVRASLRPFDIGGDPYGREWGFGGEPPHGGELQRAVALWSQGDTEGLKNWLVPEEIPGEPVTVNVLSETAVGVDIQFRGELTNPVMQNLSNNSSFEYLGIVPSGAVLHVTAAGNVTLNGSPAPGSYAGHLTAQGGANTFLFTAADQLGGSADILIQGAF